MHVHLFAVRSIAAAVTAAIAALAAPALAQETITVRTNTFATGPGAGPADTRYTGFLHSLTPTLPGAAYFEALEPSSFRTGVLTNLDANGNLNAGDFDTYARVVAAGATFEYVVSDAVYVAPSPINWPGGSTDVNYAAWEATLDAKIAAALAAGGGAYFGRFDVWNEPDFSVAPGQYFWPDQTAAGRDRFFETWRRAYVKIRAQLPNAEIVGPSMAMINGVDGSGTAYPNTGKFIHVNAFLDYAKANNVLPDIVAVHVFDKDLVGPRVDAVRASMAARGIDRPVALNEYVGQHEQTRPGVLPHYFAAMRGRGVSYGIHATWNEPASEGGGDVGNTYNDSLNGLLTHDTKLPRSTWWVYKRYAEMVGSAVQVDPGTTITGLASVDAAADQATFLLGRDFNDNNGTTYLPPAGSPAAASLQVRGIAASLGVSVGTPLRLELQRIADSGYAAAPTPTSVVSTFNAPSGSFTVALPNFGWSDAYFVRITRNTP